MSKKKVGQGQRKAEKVNGTKKKQLEEHFAANWVNWQKVSNMIVHRKNILDKQEFPCNEH